MASSSFKYDAWDAKFNQPIVGGKVRNPTTGDVEDAGPIFTSGPPSINAIWVNVGSSLPAGGGWRSVGASIDCPIDDVFAYVTTHIREGLYSIVSLNASAYSLTIMCNSTATFVDFRKAIRTMRSDLDQSKPITTQTEGNTLKLSSVEDGVTFEA